MAQSIEIITLITSVLGLLLAIIGIWNVSKSIVRRLAIIQNRLDALKGLTISLKSRTEDIEKYLAMNEGYHIRSSNDLMESSFLKQYEESDTGF